MGHFSYVGDADVGPRVNLSAGIITCNYDGRNKHRTTIGRDAFVGSGTLLVAPVELGDEAHTGAGAVVTRDVPAGKLAYGIPARIKGTSPLSSQEKAAPQNQEEALEDRESE
jgi:bifunctional UDP-N-acetylglucosamine pyrophosphorylase/glucosamine-1-phosphate N-acetyltransferase